MVSRHIFSRVIIISSVIILKVIRNYLNFILELKYINMTDHRISSDYRSSGP